MHSIDWHRLAIIVFVAVATATAGRAWSGQAEDQPRATQGDENPYLARDGMSPDDLLDFIDRMKSKPKSIRHRPGFALAILDAADRIMASDASSRVKSAALIEKLDQLHYQACFGDVAADDQLAEMIDTLRDEKSESIAQRVEFLTLERRALKADELAAEAQSKLAVEAIEYLKSHPLEARHLRLASATVRIINHLPSDEDAEKAYKELGAAMGKSDDREMVRYGRQIEKAAKPATLVGKPMEVEGTLVDGAALDWASYRGKVVLVDFWATWCGPCRAEIPNVKQAYAEYHDRGFDVVGISLDTDRESLEQVIRDEDLPWPNLFSEGDASGWRHPLAVKYNVRAIPATFLIDRSGKVVAEDVRGEALLRRIEQLLGDAAPRRGAADDPPDKTNR